MCRFHSIHCGKCSVEKKKVHSLLFCQSLIRTIIPHLSVTFYSRLFYIHLFFPSSIIQAWSVSSVPDTVLTLYYFKAPASISYVKTILHIGLPFLPYIIGTWGCRVDYVHAVNFRFSTVFCSFTSRAVSGDLSGLHKNCYTM